MYTHYKQPVPHDVEIHLYYLAHTNVKVDLVFWYICHYKPILQKQEKQHV